MDCICGVFVGSVFLLEELGFVALEFDGFAMRDAAKLVILHTIHHTSNFPPLRSKDLLIILLPPNSLSFLPAHIQSHRLDSQISAQFDLLHFDFLVLANNRFEPFM